MMTFDEICAHVQQVMGELRFCDPKSYEMEVDRLYFKMQSERDSVNDEQVCQMLQREDRNVEIAFDEDNLFPTEPNLECQIVTTLQNDHTRADVLVADYGREKTRIGPLVDFFQRYFISTRFRDGVEEHELVRTSACRQQMTRLMLALMGKQQSVSPTQRKRIIAFCHQNHYAKVFAVLGRLCDFCFGRVDTFPEQDLGDMLQLIELTGAPTIWTGYNATTGEVDMDQQPEWARLYDTQLQSLLDELEEVILQDREGNARRYALQKMCQAAVECRHDAEPRHFDLDTLREWEVASEAFYKRVSRDTVPPCTVLYQLGASATGQWETELYFSHQGPVRRIVPTHDERHEFKYRLSFDQFRASIMDHMVRANWSLDSTYNWILHNVTEVGKSMMQMVRFYNGSTMLRAAIRNNWSTNTILAHINMPELKSKYTDDTAAELYYEFSVIDTHPEQIPARFVPCVVNAVLSMIQVASGKKNSSAMSSFLSSSRLQDGPGKFLHVVVGKGRHSRSRTEGGRQSSNTQSMIQTMTDFRYGWSGSYSFDLTLVNRRFDIRLLFQTNLLNCFFNCSLPGQTPATVDTYFHNRHTLYRGDAELGIWQVSSGEYTPEVAARALLAVITMTTDIALYYRNDLSQRNNAAGRRCKTYVATIIHQIGRLTLGPSVSPTDPMNQAMFRLFVAINRTVDIFNHLQVGGQQWGHGDFGCDDHTRAQLGHIYYRASSTEPNMAELVPGRLGTDTWNVPNQILGLAQLANVPVHVTVVRLDYPVFTHDIEDMTNIFTLYCQYTCRANIQLSGEFPNPTPGRQRYRYCAEPLTSIPTTSDDCVDGTELNDILSPNRPHVIYGTAFNDPEWWHLPTLARIYREFTVRRNLTRELNILSRLRYTNDAPYPGPNFNALE